MGIKGVKLDGSLNIDIIEYIIGLGGSTTKKKVQAKFGLTRNKLNQRIGCFPDELGVWDNKDEVGFLYPNRWQNVLDKYT